MVAALALALAVKGDDHYKKTAYRKCQPLDGPPANSSDAQR